MRTDPNNGKTKPGKFIDYIVKKKERIMGKIPHDTENRIQNRYACRIRYLYETVQRKKEEKTN